MKTFKVEHQHMRILESTYYRYITLLSQIHFMLENKMDKTLIQKKLDLLENRLIALELVKKILLEAYLPKINGVVDFNFDKDLIEVYDE